MDVAPVFHPSKSSYWVFTTDLLLPVLLTLGIFAVLYIVLFSPLFAIAQIKCQLDYQPCEPSSMLAEIQRLKGQNIVRFDTSALSARLTSADFTVREANITKTLPATVSVSLLSAYPVLALKIADLQEWIVLDDQFRVIRSLSSAPNVPTVVLPGTITLAVGVVPSDTNLISALNLARSLASAIPTITSIRLVDQDTLELTLPNNLHALMTPRGDIATQIASLQGILSDATITAGKSVVDLRFSQPILK